ncbi:MAG: CPBP family intramembrane metalloprotease [Sedimentisphaerales bacterium]|nr:CPBP family intramembrane metalloprotease [Sedimentisphaerales bacterium]
MTKFREKTRTEQEIQSNLNLAPGSYLESTSRPWYGLLFLMPWIILYEVGTLVVSAEQITGTPRIVAFTWLMGLAKFIGMDQSLAWAFPGLVVVIILMCWHLSTHHPWAVNFKWLGWMAAESIVMTIPLFVLAALMNSSNPFSVSLSTANEAGPSSSGYLANIVTSIGAGIYEELVFRLILIGLIVMVLEDLCKVKLLTASMIAVLISAGAFAAHHYIGIIDGHIVRLEDFKIPSFVFRTFAGVYFAVIFRLRGFGITAGTHIAYDMIHFTWRFFFIT